MSFMEQLLNAAGRKETGKERDGVRVSRTTSVNRPVMASLNLAGSWHCAPSFPVLAPWALASMPAHLQQEGDEVFSGLAPRLLVR